MPVMAVTSVTVARADRLFNKSDTGDHSCKWSTNGRSYVNTSVMDQPATSADITLHPATSADITLCYCGVLMMQGTPGLCKTSSLRRRGTPTDRTAEIRIWSCHACRRITARCHDLWQSDTGGRSYVTWYGEKFISPRQTIFFHFALSKLMCHDFASYFAYFCPSLPIRKTLCNIIDIQLAK